MPEFYMILASKIIIIPEFLLYLPEKNNKIPEFYVIFARKMPEFYIIIARKYFSRIWGAGTCPPPAPTGPTSPTLMLCSVIAAFQLTRKTSSILSAPFDRGDAATPAEVWFRRVHHSF